MSEWRPIATAPKDKSVLLARTGTSFMPMYCGRFRCGTLRKSYPLDAVTGSAEGGALVIHRTKEEAN